MNTRLACAALIGAFCLLCRSSATGSQNTLGMTINATVNGGSFAAQGWGAYDESLPGHFTNEIDYTALAPGYDVYAFFTFFNTIYCPITIPAVNLMTATSGAFAMERTVTIKDTNGQVVAALTGNGSVGPDPQGTYTSVGAMTLTGSCSGPFGVENISGYKQLLQQQGPGSIYGSFTQTMNLQDGSVLSLTAVSHWTYAGSGHLPADEYSYLSIDSLSYDPVSRKLLLSAYGNYEVVPEPSALLALGVGVTGLFGLAFRKRPA